MYPITHGVHANTIQESVQDIFLDINKCNSVIDEATRIEQEYMHFIQTSAKKVLETALTNNLVRLAQSMGTRMPKGNNTIQFIGRQEIPPGKTKFHMCGQ